MVVVLAFLKQYRDVLIEDRVPQLRKKCQNRNVFLISKNNRTTRVSTDYFNNYPDTESIMPTMLLSVTP